MWLILAIMGVGGQFAVSICIRCHSDDDDKWLLGSTIYEHRQSEIEVAVGRR